LRFAEAIEPELSDFGRLAPIKDWGGKLVGAVVRLAGLLHVAGHARPRDASDAPIEAATVERACRIGHYLIDHALIAFSQIGVDQTTIDAKHIWNRIAGTGRRELSKAELYQLMKGRFKTKGKMTPGYERLRMLGYIHEKDVEHTGAPGRPREPMIVVNPLALTARCNSKNPGNSHIGRGAA
jgi:replicative DNA helicase